MTNNTDDNTELRALAEQAGQWWAEAVEIPVAEIIKESENMLTEADVSRARAAMKVWLELHPLVQALVRESVVREDMIFAYCDPIVRFVCRLEDWFVPIDTDPKKFYGLVGDEFTAQDSELYGDLIAGLKDMGEALKALIPVPVSSDDQIDSTAGLVELMAAKERKTETSVKASSSTDALDLKLRVYGMVEEMFNAVKDKDLIKRLEAANITLMQMELLQKKIEVVQRFLELKWRRKGTLDEGLQLLDLDD